MTVVRNPDHVTVAVADGATAIEFFELLGFRKQTRRDDRWWSARAIHGHAGHEGSAHHACTRGRRASSPALGQARPGDCIPWGRFA